VCVCVCVCVCATLDFIHLAQNKESLRDSVNTKTTFRPPQ